MEHTSIEAILLGIVGILGGKHIWDVIKKKMTLKAEKDKVEMEMEMAQKKGVIEMNVVGQDEIKELLNTQIEELKNDLRVVKEQYENAVHKITELEIKLATLKERYAEKTILHSRGNKKKD